MRRCAHRPAGLSLGLLLVALAAVFMPAGALADQAYIPPGNSGANQYVEDVPTAAGNSSSNTVARHRSHAGSNHASSVPASTLHKLQRSGSDGRMAAALATASAPAAGSGKNRAGGVVATGGGSGGGGAGGSGTVGGSGAGGSTAGSGAHGAAGFPVTRNEAGSPRTGASAGGASASGAPASGGSGTGAANPARALTRALTGDQGSGALFPAILIAVAMLFAATGGVLRRRRRLG